MAYCCDQRLELRVDTKFFDRVPDMPFDCVGCDPKSHGHRVRVQPLGEEIKDFELSRCKSCQEALTFYRLADALPLALNRLREEVDRYQNVAASGANNRVNDLVGGCCLR